MRPLSFGNARRGAHWFQTDRLSVLIVYQDSPLDILYIWIVTLYNNINRFSEKEQLLMMSFDLVNNN